MELEHQAPKCSDSDGVVGLTVQRPSDRREKHECPSSNLTFPGFLMRPPYREQLMEERSSLAHANI